MFAEFAVFTGRVSYWQLIFTEKPNTTSTQLECWSETSRGPTINKPHLCLIKSLALYLPRESCGMSRMGENP